MTYDSCIDKSSHAASNIQRRAVTWLCILVVLIRLFPFSLYNPLPIHNSDVSDYSFNIFITLSLFCCR